ncbi:MAG TPA: DUF4912 domain-containing protein [Candidatus Eisenbacteria bacterium]|nr:DUF4912 domain-containing protein [Candidatus Eisenbacteria bacterium]
MSDRALLLARDPWHLFAAWDVEPATRLRALRSLGRRAVAALAAVRLVRDDGPQPPIDLPPGAGERVLDAVPGRSHVLEVGLRLRDGSFVALVRSPPASTPPATVSPDTTVTWVHAAAPTTPIDVRWSGRRVRRVRLVPRGGPSSHVHT